MFMCEDVKPGFNQIHIAFSKRFHPKIISAQKNRFHGMCRPLPGLISPELPPERPPLPGKLKIGLKRNSSFTDRRLTSAVFFYSPTASTPHQS